MQKEEKKAFVLSLRQALDDASLVVVTQQKGLTVSDTQKLRSEMREKQAFYKVMKNTLAKRVVQETAFEGITKHLSGPTALAYSQDPVAAAKVAVDFSKKNEKLSILGGVLNGQYLDASQVASLAALPSLDELRGKIVGVINAPATKVVRVIGTPATSLARVFSAYAEKKPS